MTALLAALTLLGYALGFALARRTRFPLANPTLIGVLIVMIGLLAWRVPYATYADANTFLTFLLTPAVVALAVPMYRQRALLRREWRALILGGGAGTLTAMLVGWLGGSLLGLERGVHLAATTASATSPVALAVNREVGGSAALAATLAIVAGLVGASLGPAWLTRLGVTGLVARGVAIGSVSHGIGTARVRDEGEAAGAASSLGVGLGALTVTLVMALVARAG
ncbi:LrgB family protein [Deinococcus yavapaiensis]|uniref:Putative effector of murein hydrolase n=1 Tax=Deinococcus yavapaiensis KR-236 TaxID=694435 RepID=A0A318SGU7_9DEIO|nr:LrgB family protein [Deinococcus yavapaiensis]PYE56325.1 putative effector of murein hydrolase [Deinococcus yavapaiensis KR-236]